MRLNRCILYGTQNYMGILIEKYQKWPIKEIEIFFHSVLQERSKVKFDAITIPRQ